MSVSVYFSSQSIRVAEGSVRKGTYNINRLISVPTPTDAIINGIVTNDAALRDAVTKLWTDHKLPKNNICITIDSSSVMLKMLTVPLTSENNIISIVKREYADIDNFEDMLFDYSVYKPKLEDSGGQILAFAAERSFIGSYIDLFKDIKGASIKRITAAQESTVRFMRMCQKAAGKTIITAVIDGNILSLNLYAEGDYKITNRSRLLADRGTPEFADEIAYAISSIIQFNRAEISDIYFFGLTNEDQMTLNNINLLLDRQNSVIFPYMNEMMSLKTTPVGSSEPTEFMYCVGAL